MLVLTTKERANTIPSVCSIKPPSDLKTEPHGHHQPDRQLSIPLALHTSITQSDADFYHSSCEVLLGCQGIEKKMVRVAFSFVGQLRADSVRYRQAYTWQHTGNGCSATRSSFKSVDFPFDVSRWSGCRIPHLLHVTTRYHSNGSQIDRGMAALAGICLGKRRASIAAYRSVAGFVYEKQGKSVANPIALEGPLLPLEQWRTNPCRIRAAKTARVGRPPLYLFKNS